LERIHKYREDLHDHILERAGEKGFQPHPQARKEIDDLIDHHERVCDYIGDAEHHARRGRSGGRQERYDMYDYDGGYGGGRHEVYAMEDDYMERERYAKRGVGRPRKRR